MYSLFFCLISIAIIFVFCVFSLIVIAIYTRGFQNIEVLENKTSQVLESIYFAVLIYLIFVSVSGGFIGAVLNISYNQWNYMKYVLLFTIITVLLFAIVFTMAFISLIMCEKIFIELEYRLETIKYASHSQNETQRDSILETFLPAYKIDDLLEVMDTTSKSKFWFLQHFFAAVIYHRTPKFIVGILNYLA